MLPALRRSARRHRSVYAERYGDAGDLQLALSVALIVIGYPAVALAFACLFAPGPTTHAMCFVLTLGC